MTRGRLGAATGVIGALIGALLVVIPTAAVHAQVAPRVKAAEVAGPLLGSEIRLLPFAAGHAAIHWAGNPDAKVTVAFSNDGLTFGPAIAVEHDEVGMQRANGETYGALLPARGALVARVTADRPLGRLNVLALADDVTSTVKALLPAVPAGGVAAAEGGIVPRAGWGADESLRFDRRGKEVWPPVFETVQKLVVHHTAGANGESGEAAMATIRSMYYYHAVTQGWGDIGYNFLIDATGVVYKGRVSHGPGSTVDTLSGENAAGQGVTAGHAYGYNSGSVGIAILGTFSTVDASLAAKTALQNLLVGKARAHGLDTAKVGLYTNPLTGAQASFENVPGHREVPDNATDCPGGYFLDNVLKPMRSAMQPLAGPADVAPPADPTALKAAATNKKAASLTWVASAGDTGTGDGGVSGVAGYDVWRAPAGGAAVRLGSTTGLTFTDGDRAPNVQYEYTVRTYDGAGNRSAGVKTPRL